MGVLLQEVRPWILFVITGLIVGCGGKTNGESDKPDASDAGEASMDASVGARTACDVSSMPSCTGPGAPPCDWSAATSNYCGVMSSDGPLWRCGSYTAFEFFGIDVADYFFYDAAGTLVGNVHDGPNGLYSCTSYGGSFMPPPPRDPMVPDVSLAGCVPVLSPCARTRD